MFTLLVSVAAHGAPWLCGETDVIYDSQSFCASACGGDCVEMTLDSGTCSGTYKYYAFDRTTNKTYALSVSKGKWADFSSGLAIIRDARTNDILKGLLSFSGESEAWIGLYDPNMTQSFNVVNDTRFKWRDNTVLNYRNWADGQPDNKLNPAGIGQTDIYGEHYGVINLAGLWSDAASNVMMNALVEFAGVQSCVSGTVPGENVTPGEMESAYCSGSSNCYLCTDNNDIYQCAQGEGGYLCPQGQQECNVNYAEAGCPAGTVLNPVTDKCETAGTTICANGIYNPATNKCETAVTKTCPSGYTYNSSLNKCQANPVCSSGAYNSTAKKCVINATLTCPAGSYNPSTGKCETEASFMCPPNYQNGYDSVFLYYDPADELCAYNVRNSGGGNWWVAFLDPTLSCPYKPDGTSVFIMTGSGKCEAPATVTCTSGFTYDSSSGQCVTAPTCSGGGVFNSSTNKCELTVSNTCPSGMTYNSSLNTCQAPPLVDVCPSGMTYDTGLDRCVAPAVCSGGGILNAVSDKCETIITSGNCPTGYTFDPVLDICRAPVNCPTGATYNASTDRCEAAVTTSCPTGYTYNSSLNKCQANPVCSSGSTYDPSAKKCLSSSTLLPCPEAFEKVVFLNGGVWAEMICYDDGWSEGTACGYSCAGPMYKYVEETYRGYHDTEEECIYECSRYKDYVIFYDDFNCQCSGLRKERVYTFSEDDLHHEFALVEPSISCPSDFTYDSALSMCVKTPTCSSGGTFNASTNKCELTVSTSCPAGMTYNSAAGKCVTSATCSQGVYDAALDVCKISVSTLCPSSYSYDSAQNKCLKAPVCTQGSYSVTVDKCVADAAKACPTGTIQNGTICQAAPSCQSGSYDSTLNKCFAGATCPSSGNPCVNVGGTYKCSAYGCYSSTDQGNYNNEDTDEGANDKKADGEVDEAGQCLGTIYIFNGGDRRCRKPGVQTGFTDCCKDKDSWFGLSECKPAEQALATLRDWGEVDGQCHQVGEYCSEKWLSVCVQKKKTYCCFGSALARIIGEQGRQQLGIGWGTPKSPECRGFTPEEFQKLDFDKIDFSEWFEHYVEPEMQQNINENIRNAFENIPVPVVQ